MNPLGSDGRKRSGRNALLSWARGVLSSAALLVLGAGAEAGIADTPLPQFTDGKQSVLIMPIPGVVKRDRLQMDFLCSSLAGSPVDIGVEIFAPDGTRLNDVGAGVGALLNVAPGRTVTIGTSSTATYLESTTISLANVTQGSARVVGSSPDVRCNAVIVDNLVTPPVSLATLSSGVQPTAGAALSGAPLPQFADAQTATHAALFPGVVKRGDVETVFFCTSLASGNIDVGVEVFDNGGVLLNAVASGNGAALNVAPGATVTFATTTTLALSEDVIISIPPVGQGVARVVSTSDQLRCNALVLDAALTPPTAMSGLPGTAGSSTPGPTLSAALPQFSDGKASVHVLTVPGVAKRDRLETEFLCTSLDSVPIDIGVQIFDIDGALANDVSAGEGAVIGIGPRQTVTIGTSTTASYLESGIVPLANGLQGVGRVVASSDKVRCSVMLVDDQLTPPAALSTLRSAVQPMAGAVPSTLPLPQFSSGRQATHAALFPGVVKRADVETDFFCTSLASVPIDLGVEILNANGTVANSIFGGNGALLDVAPGATVTIGTTGTAVFLESTVISLPGIAQGLARVVSTSGQVICTAAVLDAGLSPPGALSDLIGFAGIAGAASPTSTPTPTATPTRTPTPVCGDGTIEHGEQCDDGNTTAGDGCDATCRLECHLPINGAKVIVGKLDTPPGDDKFIFKGTLIVPVPMTPLLNPQATGMRSLLFGVSRGLAEVSLAPGAGGWTANGAGTKWTYATDTLKISFSQSTSTPWEVKFKVKAKAGAFVAAPADLPATGFVVLAPNQCGRVSFAGVPSCAFNAAASKLKCK